MGPNRNSWAEQERKTLLYMIEGLHNQEINVEVRKRAFWVGLKYGQQEATKTLNIGDKLW